MALGAVMAGAGAFTSIRDIAGQTWETIKTAFMSGDLAGAAWVGLAALKLAWLTGLQPLKKAWAGLKMFLADSWTVIVYSILKLGNNLWYGLLYGLKSIGNAMQDAWAFIWNGIITAFEKTVLEIQKVWIKTKGFFDSDEEVDAEIARVERAYNERKSARENAKAQASAQRDRTERVFSVPICPGIFPDRTLDPGLTKQREPASLARSFARKRRSAGYPYPEQGTVESSRNPRKPSVSFSTKTRLTQHVSWRKQAQMNRAYAYEARNKVLHVWEDSVLRESSAYALFRA